MDGEFAQKTLQSSERSKVLCSFKSVIGETGPPSGLAAIVRACLTVEKALHGPHLHFRQLSIFAGEVDEDGNQSPRLATEVAAGQAYSFHRTTSGDTEENTEPDESQACALVGHDDGRIQLVDVATGHELKLFDGHKESRARHRCRRVAEDGTVFHWNLEDGSGVELTPPEDGDFLNCCIRSLRAEWNEKRLAITGNDDGYFVVWNLTTHEAERVLSCLLTAERHYLVTVIEVCWPKARALVGFDNGVLQSLGSTASHATVEHSEHSYAQLNCSVDASPRIWGLPMAASQSSLKGHKDTITALSVQWKLKRAISGSQDKSARLWNISRSECIRVISGHLTGLRNLCVDWDLGVALSSAWDGEMQLWEIADEVDSDFALQAVGGDVRAGGIALLTVKEVKDDNSEEEAEEIYTDTRDTFKLK
eukprot:s673_g12.t2